MSNIEVLNALVARWETEAEASTTVVEPVAGGYPSVPLSYEELVEFLGYEEALQIGDFANVQFDRVVELSTIFGEWQQTEEGATYEGTRAEILETLIAEIEATDAAAAGGDADAADAPNGEE